MSLQHLWMIVITTSRNGAVNLILHFSLKLPMLNDGHWITKHGYKLFKWHCFVTFWEVVFLALEAALQSRRDSRREGSSEVEKEEKSERSFLLFTLKDNPGLPGIDWHSFQKTNIALFFDETCWNWFINPWRGLYDVSVIWQPKLFCGLWFILKMGH